MTIAVLSPVAPKLQTGTTLAGKWLAAAIVLCVFEGAVRKWVIPNAGAAVHAVPYFAKDLALAAAAWASLGRRGNRAVLGSIRDVLIFSTALIITGTVLVLDGLAPVGAVVSFRSLVLLPWVALLVGPALRPADVRLLCFTVGVCAAVNAVLGGLQFFLPAGHVLNQLPSSRERAIESVGRIRATGTFAFLAGMSSLCIFACWAGAVTVLQRPLSPLGYGYAFAGLVCSFESMSRTGVMYGLGLICLVMAFHPRGRRVGVIAGITLAVGYLGFADVLGPRTDEADPGISNAILVRHKHADTVGERLIWMFSDPLYAIAEFPLGTGLGRGQTGQRAADETKYSYTFEVEPARMVYEIGLLGLAGALLTRIGVPLVLWSAWGRAPIGRRRQWETAFYPSLALFPFLIYMNTCFDHIMATYATIITAVAIAAVAAPITELSPPPVSFGSNGRNDREITAGA